MSDPPRGGPFGRLSLVLRLALLSAAATALVVAASFLVLRARAGAEVRRGFAAELAGTQRALRGLQERDLRLLLATGAVVSTSPTLRAALETRRVEANSAQPARPELLATIRREAERVFAELDHDLLVVADESGRALVALGRSASLVPPDLSQVPAVRHALAADQQRADSSFGVLRLDGAVYQVGSAAILLQGFPSGVLVLGDRLERRLPELGAAAGSDVMVTAGDDVLAALPDRPELRAGAAALHAAARDTMPHRVSLAGEEYVVASQPLGAMPDGRPVLLHVLRSLAGAVRPLEVSLGRSFLLMGALAVLLAGLGGAAAARASFEPLGRFAAFLRAGAERGVVGRYEADTAPAEIASLTETYNALVASLEKQHHQLEERSQQLTAANDSLTEEITQRARAEASLRASEEALRQSQKLESLGTLAGGVAHDFNNLITVITGYAALMEQDLPADSPAQADVKQIENAAMRAGGLVSQLLAFSRKQVLQPRVLDLNHAVTGAEKMLARLIGEDIDLVTELDPALARVIADPGMMDQVIMNLVVNARDAMPTGGRIVIATRNVVLDDAYADRPESLPAGPAVMLSVSDTGSGMDDATRARIFEPFFTTKDPGKGTGLGLSTVYGIVKQSGGSISVYSELGRGTQFRLYFPPVRARRDSDVSETGGDGAWPRGSETVLVAEDEDQVRGFLERTLTQLGYRVLGASHGDDALRVARGHAGPIHVLLSDVVMPAMSGQQLAERLRAERPDVRVIFLSGYSDDAVTRHGVLAPDSVFLQKPVSPDRLARLVRAVLDGQPARV